MEFGVINSNRGAIQVSRQLRDMLVGFTVEVLLEEPCELYSFASEYFNALMESFLVQAEEVEIIQSKVSFKEPKSAKINERAISYSYFDKKDEEDDGSDEEIKETIYRKSEIEELELDSALSKCFLFKSFDESSLDRIKEILFPLEIPAGKVVIKQNDSRTEFYVIESGIYEVYVLEDGESKPKLVHTYSNNGYFGELAVMYNQNRSATVVAKTPGKLWCMHGHTFKRLVMDEVVKKRDQYYEMIYQNEDFKNLTWYQKVLLVDALVPMQFEAGTIIMYQGSCADGMYFIEEGSVSCTIENLNTMEKYDMLTIFAGGYFGEFELVTESTRIGTVTAVTDLKLGFLDAYCFEPLLGPCVDAFKAKIKNSDEERARLKEKCDWT